MGRGATWAAIGRPAALAASTRARIARHPSPCRLDWASDRLTAPPEARASSSTSSNSPSRSPKSEMSSMTPWPASATPAAMAPSSAALARSDGVGSPVAVRWLRVREVDTPSAPARSASAVSRRISAASAGVASSSRAPRSPMT
jgi:hypothetical protein